MEEPSQIAYWAENNYSYHWRRVQWGWNWSYYRNLYTEQFYTPDQGDTYMQSMCNAAKNQGIIIFTIAMGATAHGEQEMRSCASSTGHFYATSGAELVAIFEAIAKQITDLRLTL